MEKKSASPERPRKQRINYDDDQDIRTPKNKSGDPFKDFLKNVSDTKQSLPKTGSYAKQYQQNVNYPEWKETVNLMESCGIYQNHNGQPFRDKNTFLKSDITVIATGLSKSLN